MLTLLVATTDATQSTAFDVCKNQRPASFMAPGLAGSETATLQYFDGTDWHDMPSDVITPASPVVTVYGPLKVRVNKSATASVVPVIVATDFNLD
jgi:hypothetical protein